MSQLALQRARSDFKLVVASDLRRMAIERVAGGMPLPCWPNNRWCFEVAAYAVRSVLGGASLLDKGGSVSTYVRQLSHILDYCSNNGISLLQMSDARFVHFIKGLQAEKKVVNAILVDARKLSQVIRIGRVTLDLLSYVGEMFGHENFVSADGNIKAYRKTFVPTGKNGENLPKMLTFWYHPCLPTPSPPQPRVPVSDRAVSAIRKSVSTGKEQSFIKKRRLVLLRLLENTGGRRIEIANLTVDSIQAAVEKVKAGLPPSIQMHNAKQRDGIANRVVQVSRADVAMFSDFIEFYRKPLMRKKFGSADHKFLLISAKNGRPLDAKTIWAEVNLMRRAAGIDDKAHPHLFRHRYVMNVLIGLLRGEIALRAKEPQDGRENLATVDSCLHALRRERVFLEKVREATAHSRIESIEHYIHFAYAEIYGLNNVFTYADQESKIRGLVALADELEGKMAYPDKDADALLKETYSQIKSILADLKQ